MRDFDARKVAARCHHGTIHYFDKMITRPAPNVGVIKTLKSFEYRKLKVELLSLASLYNLMESTFQIISDE